MVNLLQLVLNSHKKSSERQEGKFNTWWASNGLQRTTSQADGKVEKIGIEFFPFRYFPFSEKLVAQKYM